jgi:WD40 repeat protein
MSQFESQKRHFELALLSSLTPVGVACTVQAGGSVKEKTTIRDYVDRLILLFLLGIGTALSGGTVSAGDEPKVTTLKAHEKSLFSLAFSPDGKTLASRSAEDHQIKLWEVATGKERANIDKCFGNGRIMFSSDSKTLAVEGSGEIKLWDVATGKERSTIAIGSVRVTSVAYSPDGKTMAVGYSDRTIRLWDVATGMTRATLKGYEAYNGGGRKFEKYSLGSVVFSPDGKTLASGGEGNTIKMWDVATGKEQATLKGHTDSVNSVAYSPDGKTLASGGWDKTIKLWDLATLKERDTFTGKENATLPDNMSFIVGLAYSPDGKTLASAELGLIEDGIKLWDVATAKVQFTLLDHHPNGTFTFSPDGKTLALGGKQVGEIKLWDLSTGKERFTLSGSKLCGTLAFSPDGKTLAAVCERGTIQLWDLSTGK